MTDSLRISTNKKRLLINDGPAFIEFNPSDVAFVDRFYIAIGEFESKLEEVEKKGGDIDASGGNLDANGVPENFKERIDLVREVCSFMNQKIDDIFGPGTADKVFEGAMDIDAYQQFFEGLIPFIEKARSSKVSKYTATANPKRKVMK